MEENRMQLAAKALVWQLGVWLLSALVLFGSAGTLAWPAGWIFFTTFFGFVLGLCGWLLLKSPSLLKERLTFLRRDQPFWDRIWLVAFYLLSLIWLALMPLDAVRWHWSQIPLTLAVFGTLLLLCALAGIFWTVSTNLFASPVVRLQLERGHQVISSGPYRHIRHPLYAAACVFYLSVPLLLGSWLGFALAPVFVGLLALRAKLEEHVLLKELPGYDVYTEKTPYCFVPRVW